MNFQPRCDLRFALHPGRKANTAPRATSRTGLVRWYRGVPSTRRGKRRRLIPTFFNGKSFPVLGHLPGQAKW